MIKKRYIITALGIVSVLLASLFVTNVLLANPGGEYDPWIDTNDDGIIDIVDVAIMAYIYGTEGTPINKTELLLELEARIDSLNWTLINEYYNKSISDSRFAQLVHTHSGSDISYGTLGFYGGISQIRMGSSDTNHIIYFYDAGSSTKEYIYWQDSLERFVLSDDTYISGNVDATGNVDASGFTMNPTTRYYSIPASAWMPSYDYYEFYRGPYLYATYPTTTYWYASVNLPHGAVVTSFKAYVYDNDGANIDVSLRRNTGTAVVASMAHVTSSGASPAYQQLVDTTISNNPIDNYNYAYYVWGVLRSGDSNHRLSQVYITYTIDEPLP